MASSIFSEFDSKYDSAVLEKISAQAYDENKHKILNEGILNVQKGAGVKSRAYFRLTRKTLYMFSN